MSARYVRGVAALLVLAAAYACWCRAPLIWDGAYQFNATLIMQRPYFYLTRFHTYFLWWPVVWASHVTSNVTVLQTIYGLPFLLAPAAGLLLSWWMVRDRAPHLIVWTVFGVAAATLPGQIFVINDSIFQQHLFWPIFMGMLVPGRLSGPRRAVIAVLAIFQLVHPIGMLLPAGAALACGAVATCDVQDRRRMLLRAACMAALALLAAAKLYETTKIPALYDSYARDEASWSTALDRWRAGVRGWPLRGMWFMWTAGVLVFMHGRNPTGRRTKPGGLIAALALLCAATGAACWVYWAGDGQLWWKALDYRRWILPLTAPFFILATIEACLLALARRRNVAAASAPEPALQFAGGHTVDYGRAIGRSPASVRHGSTEQDGSELANVLRDLAPLRPTRDAVGLLLAATFAIVLGLQSTVWHRLGGRLMADVRRYPGAIVPESAIPYLANGPLDHWATADYVMAMQGKSPRQLLMDPRSEEHIYDRPPKIPHWDFYPHPPDPAPGAMGWFDLRPLLKQLPAQPPRTHGGPVRLDIKSTPD